MQEQGQDEGQAREALTGDTECKGAPKSSGLKTNSTLMQHLFKDQNYAKQTNKKKTHDEQISTF